MAGESNDLNAVLAEIRSIRTEVLGVRGRIDHLDQQQEIRRMAGEIDELKKRLAEDRFRDLRDLTRNVAIGVAVIVGVLLLKSLFLGIAAKYSSQYDAHQFRLDAALVVAGTSALMCVAFLRLRVSRR